MNFNPYEELRIYLLSRRDYLQQVLIKINEFKYQIQHQCAMPRTITIEALTTNHLCCTTTLEQLAAMVDDVCNRPLTADTNMATYDLYNRLQKWTMIYKSNVEDVIVLELSFLSGAMQ